MPVELVGTTYVLNSEEWRRETEIPGTIPHAIELASARRSWKALALASAIGIGLAGTLVHEKDIPVPDMTPGKRTGIECMLGGLGVAGGLGSIGLARRARRLANLPRN